MGDGGDFSRTLTRTIAGIAIVATVGCIDFVEPDLPELGAPAVIEATIRLSDRGAAELDARLAPGLDVSGHRRTVSLATLGALGRQIAPDSVLRNGTRRYVETWEIDPAAVGQPATFRAPSVDRVLASLPDIEWAGIRRVGPDTIESVASRDLVLRVARGEGDGVPIPDIRQWFLRIEGDSAAFGISADGAPPDTILVPARWIPEGDTLAIRLIFNQSVLLRPPPGDYLGLVTLDIRVFWTVRVRPASVVPPAAASAGRVARR